MRNLVSHCAVANEFYGHRVSFLCRYNATSFSFPSFFCALPIVWSRKCCSSLFSKWKDLKERICIFYVYIVYKKKKKRWRARGGFNHTYGIYKSCILSILLIYPSRRRLPSDRYASICECLYTHSHSGSLKKKNITFFPLVDKSSCMHVYTYTCMSLTYYVIKTFVHSKSNRVSLRFARHIRTPRLAARARAIIMEVFTKVHCAKFTMAWVAMVCCMYRINIGLMGHGCGQLPIAAKWYWRHRAIITNESPGKTTRDFLFPSPMTFEVTEKIAFFTVLGVLYSRLSCRSVGKFTSR